MESLIFNEQDDDEVYIAELTCSIHENREQNESDDNENNGIQGENIQENQDNQKNMTLRLYNNAVNKY
ncbi:14542_t:CDS:2 [Racocetra fulgida]|uniref:14542_t:CDS:1 n=1 Tax=Racocetra fulgida TaxID=60492 RepID=A0A9N8ZCQ2_9GLOM|nr:14542_t:CDS:2 [Racocetra fulgida]